MKTATKPASRKIAPATKANKRSISMRVETPTNESAFSAPVRLSNSRPLAEELVTVVEARVDAGFGNQIYIRGEGAGLSWEKGALLTCVDRQTWRWMTSGDEAVIFKLLLNDQIWSQGENLEVPPGAKAVINPLF